MGIQVLYNKKALCYIDKADFCNHSIFRLDISC